MKLKTKIKILSQIKLKKCKYCHSKENLTIDHKIPVSKGGTNDLKNLQCLCRRCNEVKSSYTEGEMQMLRKFWKQVELDKISNKTPNI